MTSSRNAKTPRMPAGGGAVPRAGGGPLIADIFGSLFRPWVSSIIRLPHVVRLAVRGGRPAVARQTPSVPPTYATLADDFQAYGLLVRSGPSDRPPAQTANPGEVRGELGRLLAAEEALARHQVARDAARRVGERTAVRQLVSQRTPGAAALHRRTTSVARRQRVARPLVRTASAVVRRLGPSARRELPRVARAPHRPAWREALRVAAAGLLVGGVVAAAASMSHLPKVARETEARARRATTTFQQGVRSLLAADAAASAAAFSASLDQYEGALRSVRESTTAVQRLAGRLDPAQRFRSAEALLLAGARLASAGERAAALLRVFGEPGSRSLTERVTSALPDLEALVSDLTEAERRLSAVDLGDLPESERAAVGAVRERVEALRRQLALLLTSRQVVLELLGARHDRQYLVLFQNNRELRPTGGFLGSFALVDVSRGAVTKIHADTIYNPDGQLKDFLAPPGPLQKITDRWYARDANWFADFRVSAQKVASLFERSGGPSVDGVLALTPAVLVDLLRVTGPIPMPGYEVTVTAENAVDEIQRQVTFAYDRERNEPKAFLADLIPEVFSKATSLPQRQWGDLLDALASSLRRKHLLVFFKDAEAEEAALALGWGGALEPPAATAGVLADTLGRFEANVGGHKTDDLIEQSVAYDVSADSPEGAVTATLVVTRHHRGSPGGTPGLPPEEDPQRKPNIVYERTFVPWGSTLLEARGFTPEAAVPSPLGRETPPVGLKSDPELAEVTAHDLRHPSGMIVGEESGFATFGGWVITRPGETSVTVLKYQLPFRIPRPSLLAAILRYELHLIHQPGHQPVLTRATVRLPAAFRVAWSGPHGMASDASEQKASFAAQVDQDRTWGAVIEER